MAVTIGATIGLSQVPIDGSVAPGTQIVCTSAGCSYIGGDFSIGNGQLLASSNINNSYQSAAWPGGAVLTNYISTATWAAPTGTVTKMIDASGNITFIVGNPTVPSGACTYNGEWSFTQDGHVAFCAAGTWVTKI